MQEMSGKLVHVKKFGSTMKEDYWKRRCEHSIFLHYIQKLGLFFYVNLKNENACQVPLVQKSFLQNVNNIEKRQFETKDEHGESEQKVSKDKELTAIDDEPSTSNDENMIPLENGE